jgi:hypothetical protein
MLIKSNWKKRTKLRLTKSNLKKDDYQKMSSAVVK